MVGSAIQNFAQIELLNYLVHISKDDYIHFLGRIMHFLKWFVELANSQDILYHDTQN